MEYSLEVAAAAAGPKRPICLITGGCGFIGHHVVEHFCRNTDYQVVWASIWPSWGSGNGGELTIGLTSGAPGGSPGNCIQGRTYHSTAGEICGGTNNWGATDVEVWYPR